MERLTQGDGYSDKVWRLEIKPRSQKRVFLGEFTSNAPRGFEITITPNTVSDDAVVSEVILLEEEGKKKFFLHIENFDDRAVSAQVMPL